MHLALDTKHTFPFSSSWVSVLAFKVMSSSYITIRRCYITGVALGISTLVIDASRLIARWRLSRKVGIGMWSQHLDDLACLIALPPAMGITIAMIVGM